MIQISKYSDTTLSLINLRAAGNEKPREDETMVRERRKNRVSLERNDRSQRSDGDQKIEDLSGKRPLTGFPWILFLSNCAAGILAGVDEEAHIVEVVILAILVPSETKLLLLASPIVWGLFS